MAVPTNAAARALGINEATLEALAAFLSGKNNDATAFALPVSGTITATPTGALAATATLTNVNDTNASTTLLAANANRLGATFFNDSDQILYLKFGTTASATSFTIKMAAGAYYELPTTAVYTGRVDGIWAADSTGAARMTELTA